MGAKPFKDKKYSMYTFEYCYVRDELKTMVESIEYGVLNVDLNDKENVKRKFLLQIKMDIPELSNIDIQLIRAYPVSGSILPTFVYTNYTRDFGDKKLNQSDEPICEWKLIGYFKSKDEILKNELTDVGSVRITLIKKSLNVPILNQELVKEFSKYLSEFQKDYILYKYEITNVYESTPKYVKPKYWCRVWDTSTPEKRMNWIPAWEENGKLWSLLGELDSPDNENEDLLPFDKNPWENV